MTTIAIPSTADLTEISKLPREQRHKIIEWQVWIEAIGRLSGHQRENAIAEAADLFGCSETEVQRRAAAFKRRGWRALITAH